MSNGYSLLNSTLAYISTAMEFIDCKELILVYLAKR